MTYGAAPQDWQRFADLGLTQDLLPVVSDPAIPVSSQSKLREENRGKVPSFVLSDGHLAGMPGWSRNKAVPSDLRKWAKDTRLGICVQTREVRAIDVDIGDPTISASVRDMVEMTLGHLPCRSRPNSGKLLLAFRLPGTFLKRIIETPHGRIEFLANGQHFVAVGTHPSGVRYEWDDYTIPSLTVSEFEAVWSLLEAEFGQPDRRREEREAAGHNDAVLGLTPDEIEQALKSLDPDMPYDGWRDVGMALHHETRGEGLHYWQTWSANGADYPGDEELEYKWQSFGHYTGPQVTGKTLVKMALDVGVAVGPNAPAAAEEFDVVDTAAEEARAEAVEAAKPLKYQFEPVASFASAAGLPWIVKDVLPKAGLAVVYGASGSGKTFAVLDLVMAVARGAEWRGKRVKQSAVAYVVAEGAGGFKKRAYAYGRQHDVDLNGVPLHVLPAAPNLRDKGDTRELVRGLKALGPVGVVVVDTLAQTTPGGNENAGEDVGTALAHCKAIHEATGALVLLVHHSGKDQTKGARGWSGLRAACDAEMEVVRLETGGRYLRLSKSKDGVDNLEWGFELEVVTVGIDEDGDEITSCVVREAEVPKAKQVTRRLGGNEALVNEVLQEFAKVQTQGIEADAVVAEAVRRLPEPEAGKRDTRAMNLRRALRSLCDSVENYELDDETGTIRVL